MALLNAIECQAIEISSFQPRLNSNAVWFLKMCSFGMEGQKFGVTE